MGAATPVLALPYPSPPDPADVPADMKALADRLDIVIPAQRDVWPVSSTPPASPVEGSMWVLPVDAANGIMWVFRYRASSPSAYKWEFVGGPPMQSFVAAMETTTSTGPVTLPTAGPTIAVPRAGDYHVEWGCVGAFSLAGGYAMMQLFKDGVSSTIGANNAANNYTSVAQAWAFAAVTSGFTTFYAGTGGGTASFGTRWMLVTPRRVQ